MYSNKLPKINYIGNKEKLASWICDNFPKDCSSVFDAFSGGASIGYEAKKRGLRVIANDIMTINYLIGNALIENSFEKITQQDIDIICSGKPKKGFMFKNFSNKYFYDYECMELDLYRQNIINNFTNYKKSMAFILIRRAMIRKMPYSRFNIAWEKVKQLRDEDYSYKMYKRKRAYHNDTIKNHMINNVKSYNNAIFDNTQKNQSFNQDVYSLSSKIEADIIYIDPPYCGTMNNYYGFYNLLDEYIISKRKAPFTNNFIDKKTILEQFSNLFSKLENFKYWIISYNNRSFPSKDDMYKILKKYSKNITICEKEHLYQITGKFEKKKNTELLFIVEN